MVSPARFFLLICLALAAQGALGANKGLLVIVNPQVPESSISFQELTAIYLRRIVVWPNGLPIVAVNQPVGSKARRQFSRLVFGPAPSMLADYWSQKHFQGINPPVVMPSTAAVVAFVRKIPGAIGYILPDQPRHGTKVIKRLAGQP